MDDASDASGCVYVGETEACSAPVDPEVLVEVGVRLCRTHGAFVAAAALRLQRSRAMEAELAQRQENEYVARVAKVRGGVVQRAGGWTYRAVIPQRDGRPKSVSRSGFKSQAQALRALRSRLADEVRAAEAHRPLTDAMVHQREEALVAFRRRPTAQRDPVTWSHQRERRATQRDRLVYYVQRPDGAIKIGTTWDIAGRMQALRNVSPVVLLGTHTGGEVAESALHRRFRAIRLDGEWFSPTDDLLTHIAHVVQVTGSRRPA
jgi:hypothetical protein